MFYSHRPKLASQTTQRIGEAGGGLLAVPRLNEEVSLLWFLLEIPQPRYRIEPKAQPGCPFRALSLVGLRLLAAQMLLGVFECIFDSPAVAITFQYFGLTHRHIGCKQEVVFLFAIWIPADDQQNRFVGYGIPQHDASIHQTLDGCTSLAECNFFPILNRGRHLLRLGQFPASFARSAIWLIRFC